MDAAQIHYHFVPRHKQPGSMSQPVVADNWFSVRFDIDSTHKPSGQRSQMSEIGVFQVADGKIVKEQFFYNMEG